MNREVGAAIPGFQRGCTSEAVRERRESNGGFAGMEEEVCIIEGGPKHKAQKQLVSLPVLLVQLLALRW